MATDTKGIIGSYLDAYRGANGKDPDFALAYEQGWFVFRDGSGHLEARKRLTEMEAMTARLVARSSAVEPEVDSPSM